MYLILDLGNTTLNVGVYENDKLIKTYKTSVKLDKTLDEYVSTFMMFYYQNDFKKEDFTDAMMSSVVPSLDNVISEAIYKVFNVKLRMVRIGVKTGMPILLDNPSELGSDLCSDSVGAIYKYGVPTIIVDMGTATKVLLVNQKGEFEGGVITPGFMLSQKALVDNASLLTETRIKAPKKVVGKNTIDCMNSGAIYGTKHMVLGLVDDFEKEIGVSCHKVLTGGNAIFFKDLLNDFIYDENLTLDGVYQILKRNPIRGK